MASYTDSLGNVYKSLPKNKSGNEHHARGTRPKTAKARFRKNNSGTGVTLPASPYYKYRMRVGKPAGPGQPGNKAGKNKVGS